MIIRTKNKITAGHVMDALASVCLVNQAFDATSDEEIKNGVVKILVGNPEKIKAVVLKKAVLKKFEVIFEN